MNIQLKVNWLSERVDDNDDNDGQHFGIYVFDCDESEFDYEAGFGSYNVIDVSWFSDECDRDLNYFLNIYENKETFSTNVLEDINKAIQNEEILTEDIRVHFKEWVYSQSLPIDDKDIWDYDEHYSNGLTHKENLKILLDNLVVTN